jgi:hypothetical protein
MKKGLDGTSSNNGFPCGAKSWSSAGRAEGRAEACALHPFAGCKHRLEEGLRWSGSGASGRRKRLADIVRCARSSDYRAAGPQRGTAPARAKRSRRRLSAGYPADAQMSLRDTSGTRRHVIRHYQLKSMSR